jgi:hypothetical protein
MAGAKGCPACRARGHDTSPRGAGRVTRFESLRTVSPASRLCQGSDPRQGSQLRVPRPPPLPRASLRGPCLSCGCPSPVPPRSAAPRMGSGGAVACTLILALPLRLTRRIGSPRSSRGLGPAGDPGASRYPIYREPQGLGQTTPIDRATTPASPGPWTTCRAQELDPASFPPAWPCERLPAGRGRGGVSFAETASGSPGERPCWADRLERLEAGTRQRCPRCATPRSHPTPAGTSDIGRVEGRTPSS